MLSSRDLLLHLRLQPRSRRLSKRSQRRLEAQSQSGRAWECAGAARSVSSPLCIPGWKRKADRSQIVSLTSAEGTPFTASAEVHPALVTAEDGEKIAVPICMLASKDEKAEDVEAFKKALKVENHVETFGDQVHVSLYIALTKWTRANLLSY